MNPNDQTWARAWVREVLLRDERPRYQVIFKAKCVRTFSYRARADEFIRTMNLLLKE